METNKRIIVALDFDTRNEALDLVKLLRGRVGFFKVGSQLFTAEGPDIVREIVGLGEEVFLDLKFHDIPTTVVKAALVAQALGVSMITVHICGGSKMVSRVVSELESAAGASRPPMVLGVTVLTSMGQEDLSELGIGTGLAEQVVRLARLAHGAGVRGFVASPDEVALIRSELKPPVVLVTPGIRPAGSNTDDQSRISTPAEALRAGADYLVIGRPITASKDPLKSLETIVDSIDGSLGLP